MPPSSARPRSRSIAHRWGPACATTTPADQWALAVRFDEEDDAAAESFLVKLTQGKAEIVDHLPGAATALAASSEGKVFILDDRGQLLVGGRKHKLAAPRALTWLGDGVVLAGADRLWLFSSDGVQVREGPAVAARCLASSSAGLLAAIDDGSVCFFADAPSAGAAARGQRLALGALPAGSTGPIAALSLDDDGQVAAACGRTVLLGDVRAGTLAPLLTAPFEIHAIALHQRRLLLASRAHGLFAVDLAVDADRRVMPFRPSLRAHTLAVRAGLLVVASDLFVATSDDGLDFLTRDLTSFVRLAEQHRPRFLASEDPLSI